MYKKTISTMLIALMVLTACGSNDEPSPSGAGTAGDSLAIVEPEHTSDAENEIIAQWKDLEETLKNYSLEDTWDGEESLFQALEELMAATDNLDNRELGEEIIQWVWNEVGTIHRNLAQKANNDILRWVHEHCFNTSGYEMIIDVTTISNTHHDPDETSYHETRYIHSATLKLNFSKEDNIGIITLMNETQEYENRFYYNPDGSPVEAPDYITYEAVTQSVYGNEITSYYPTTQYSTIEAGTLFHNEYVNVGVSIEIDDDGVHIASLDGSQIASYGQTYVEAFSELFQNLDSILFAGNPIARVNYGEDGRWVSAMLDMSPFYALISNLSGTPLEPNMEAITSVRLSYNDNLIVVRLDQNVIRHIRDLDFLHYGGSTLVGDELIEDSMMITIYPSSS